MAGACGLTDPQLIEISTLIAKKAIKPLTLIQEGKLRDLIYKRDNPVLSSGAKTYVEDWLKNYEIYKRTKELSSKYTKKGNDVEEKSIKFINDQLGYFALEKNEKFFDNDYMQGTPDVLQPEEIIDAKNSWDWTTFPLFKTEVPDRDYYWQGQGYMALTGRKHYKLIYVLSDTPMELIEKEALSYTYNSKEQYTEELLQKFVDKMTYPDIPNKYKIKVFPFERNDADIKLIKQQVLLCRTYAEELFKMVA